MCDSGDFKYNRGKSQNKDATKYEQMQYTIRNKIRIANEKQMAQRFMEAEVPEKKHNIFNLHWKVNKITDTAF